MSLQLAPTQRAARLHIRQFGYGNEGPPSFPGDGDDNGSSGASPTKAIIISVVVVVVAFATIVIVYIMLRRVRIEGRSPKYLPGKFLKTRWQRWRPVGKYNSVEEVLECAGPTSSYQGRQAGQAGQAGQANSAGVGRQTSVRSIISLPAYSYNPNATEQVLGREGERGGVDTIVEFPETEEQEEADREEEMESLYQIRAARRREMAERDARRQERREARERGDLRRLEELRREARQRANDRVNGSSGDLTADVMIAEHNSKPRDRRVSSVAYADLGQVRHDGTRLRANSAESERGGLLAGAGPVGHDRSRSEAGSTLTLDSLSRPSLAYATRSRADSGATSLTSTSSLDLPLHTPTTTGDRHSGNELVSSSSDSPNNHRHTPESTEHEGRFYLDLNQPPDYDRLDWGEAPAYTEEEIRRRESQRLSDAGRANATSLNVPRIHVQGPSAPNTPVVGNDDTNGEHTGR